MLRAISSSIFPAQQTKTPDQVRAKLNLIIKRYRAELVAMTQTGQGLLLDDMQDGPIKNARQELLRVCPWWESMHIMMRDRVSSDPPIIVTGAGEIHSNTTQPNAPVVSASQGTTDEEIDQLQSQESLPAHHNVGLGISSSTSARAQKKRKIQDHMDDEGDDNEDFDDWRSDNDQPTSIRRPAGRWDMPVRGRTLPTLDTLAEQTDSDPMTQTSRSTASARNASPGPSNSNSKSSSKSAPSTSSDKGKGKAKVPPTPASKATPRSSQADQSISDFGRYFADERNIRAQTSAQASIARESTRQRRLELKAKEKEYQQDGTDRRLDALAAKMETVHLQAISTSQAVSELANKIDAFMSKMDVVSMVLQHLPTRSKD
ncbi:hypothetical protein CF326_g9531 [Tilletia indica]|nr:hypothetical protein CF326_g9531 [Tilletia indica]